MALRKKGFTHKFLGQNIKGTPAMSARKVLHDLRVIQKRADVIVIQEFKWPWYWKMMSRVVGARWKTFPGVKSGLANPIVGGQPIMWKRSLFKPLDTASAMCHNGEAGISDDRWFRGVLLADKKRLKKLKETVACWYATAHFVVHGDKAGDPEKRRDMMNDECLDTFDKMIGLMLMTGWPVCFEGDLNIHPGTPAYRRLMVIVHKYGGTVHSTGIEFLITFPGKKFRIEKQRAWIVPNSAVYTDHPGKGMTLHVVEKDSKRG